MSVIIIKSSGDGLWCVYRDDQCLAIVMHLLDANCFGMQCLERRMGSELHLYSGKLIKEWR